MTHKDLVENSKLCALALLKISPKFQFFRQYDKRPDGVNSKGRTVEQIESEDKHPLLLLIPVNMIVLDLDIESEHHKGGITCGRMQKFINDHFLRDYKATQITKSGGVHYWFMKGECEHISSGITGIDLKCAGNLVNLYDVELCTTNIKYMETFPQSIINEIHRAKQDHYNRRKNKKGKGVDAYDYDLSNDFLNQFYVEYATASNQWGITTIEEKTWPMWEKYKAKRIASGRPVTTTDTEAKAKLEKAKREGVANNDTINTAKLQKYFEQCLTKGGNK